MDEGVWRAAGLAFQSYAGRRRRQREPEPRRILADFVIGAYAARHNYPLLTLDEGVYRAAFPGLRIVTA
jgi:predicted nucleic acid-binding protein